MQETKARFVGLVQGAPVCQRAVEQVVGADDVGLDEGARAIDRPVDMALCGEVDDAGRAERLDQFLHGNRIGDVALHEAVARVVLDVGQGLAVTSIGQQVEVGNRGVAGGQQVMDEIAADEAGAACDQYARRVIWVVLFRIHGVVFFCGGRRIAILCHVRG